METGNESTCQQQDDGVDDQEKEPQGQDTEGEGQQLQEKSQGRVQKTDDQGRDECAAEPCQFEPRHDVSADEQSNRAEQPDQK